MALRSTGRFEGLRTEPGNLQFPTLPDGNPVGHTVAFGTGASEIFESHPVVRSRLRSTGPAVDEQRYAGWQTQTTWVNPAIVDFGVIPSPVQRTVSLYNARSVTIDVTALTLPTGVTLVGPAFPVTLDAYGGVTFTLEAGITGSPTFDEFVTFTTSVGDISFRVLGRRVFNIENIPQTPMRETLSWKTDLIRSTDGSEKAYSLMQSPLTQIDYRVKFTNDIQRIKFKNNFIAGESALVVSGQKWYEARRLLDAVTALDTTLKVNTSLFDASWSIDKPVSVVTEDGTAYSGQLESWKYGPDEYVYMNVVQIRFDGENNTQQATDISQYENGVIWDDAVPKISTAQSVFGGSSLHLGSAQTEGVDIEYDPSVSFTDKDWTIDFWFRPTTSDLTSNPRLIARYYTTPGPGSEWELRMSATNIVFEIQPGGVTKAFGLGSPSAVQADTWHYLRINRDGDFIYCFIDGVQIGSRLSMTETIQEITGSPELRTRIGAYYESGFRNPFDGYIDDLRITVGAARSTEDFTPPTEPHPSIEESYLELTLGSAFGAEAPANSFVMPASLGYVSRFPIYQTYAKNLEEASYTLTFNQEEDFAELDTLYFPTFTDTSTSPTLTLPVLDFCNEISGQSKTSQLQRAEDILDSGLSNRLAFNEFPFADNVSEFQITLNNQLDVWKWRQFFNYLRGSYGEFYVPTFTEDMPGVTTAASNVFDIPDQDLVLLFGDPPDPRRNVVRFLYPNGNTYYLRITQVIDNGAEEEVTVSSAVEVGNPIISYMQRCRILGDTVFFEHHRNDDVSLRFRYRTVLL